MAVLGDMVVTLAANTTPYSKGLAKSQQDTRGWASSVGGALGSLAKAGVMAAAGAAIAGVGAAVYGTSKAFGELDEIAKSSAQLGIASEKLIGLQFAAEQSGSSAGVMTKALAKMQKGISEANSGMGTAKKSLEAMGLSISDLSAMSPDQQFNAIADAMAGIENVGDRTRVAFDLFGRSGVDLINTLSGGSGSLAEFQAEAERLNMTFSNADLSKVEEANDAMNSMGHAIKAMWGNLAISIAPAITSMAGGLASFVASTKPMLTALIDYTRFVVGNFGDLWALGTKIAALKVVGFSNDVWHVLSVNIPEALGWFLANWKDIFKTVGDFTTAVFKNIGHNVVAAWTNTQNWLSNKVLELMAYFDSTIDLDAAKAELNSMNTDISFKGLTDGFESSIKELPKMSSRAMTDTEKMLGKDIDALSGSLGEEYNKIFNPEVAAASVNAGATDITDGLFNADVKAAGNGNQQFGAKRDSVEAFKSIVGAGQKDKYQQKSLSALDKIAANTANQATTPIAVVEEL